MTIYETSDNNSPEQLTLFAADTLASHSVTPGSEKARKMTATSGRKCLLASNSTGPVGLLEKMLLDTSIWASMTCFLTWRVKATPYGRLLFQLVPSSHPIAATACGLLPTPTVSGNHNCKGLTKTSGDGLITRLKLLPTIVASEGKGACRNRYVGSKHFRGAKMSKGLRTTSTDPIYLNPSFAEKMMGFPVGWTDLEH